MDRASRGGAERAPPGSMERRVEEFLRSVRNGETDLNMTETGSTEHALSNQDKAIPSVVQKTANKNKSGMKPPFHCEICKVAVYDVETLKIHLNGKKHLKKQKCFLKVLVGEEFIKRYEDSNGILIAKCELCSEQILAVSTHLNSYSHLLAVLKVKHPEVYDNLQLRGLNKIRKEELKRIVVAEMFPEAFQQYGNLCNPAAVENIFPGQKSGCDEDCQPPAKRARVNNPPCINKSDTVSEHMKDKNSDLVHNEKDKTSDQRQSKPDSQQYPECKAKIDLKNNGSEGPFKIACNEDLYMFLQYFQISDETDVMFIQQIVKKFKSQLQEFNENTEQMTTISDLNDGKIHEEPVSKVRSSERAGSVLQHADSRTTSNASECTSNKSADDLKDHCIGECRTKNAVDSELCSNMRDKRPQDVSTVDHLPEKNSSKVTTAQATTSNSVSSHHSSDMLCHTAKKPISRPSVSSSVLKSHHQSIASIKKEPNTEASVEEPQLDCTTATNTKEPIVTATTSNSVSSHHSSDMLCRTTKKPIRPSVSSSVLTSHHQLIASIKKESDVEASVEEPQLDCPITTNTKEPMVTATTSNSVSSHHSSDMLCHTAKKPLISPSVSSSVLKSHHQSIVSIKKEPGTEASVEEPQLDCTTATNKPMVTGTTGSSLPVFDSSGTLSTGKPKCIIRPSVLSSVLRKSLPLQSTVSNKKEPDTLASDEHQASPQGCIGSAKAPSHCSTSEFSKGQPSSMDLESPLTSDKNKVASVAKELRIEHLNFPTSPSNTHDANSISFGGKKDMQISELIAEVAKFADTKPVLKGIDINQVVQILIRNRSEKNRNESQDSSS